MSERNIRFEVNGMSCANCSQTIEENLESLKGVIDAQVNFATGKGSATYNTKEVSLSEIYESIESSGYEPVSKKKNIPISDMSCANCAETNERYISDIHGVLSANVNYATDEAQVEYNPMQVSVDDMYVAIEKAGYTPVRESGEVENNEQNQRLSEAEEQLRLTIFGALLSVPLLFLLVDNFVFGGTTAPDSILGVEIGWIEVLLATPIQVVLGWPFYKNSYNAIINNYRANMDVLIALGSTTAYSYSLIVLLELIAGSIYFDTSALILVFITLGNYLEERSKSQAGSALKQLLEMEAKEATVVKNGSEIEVPVKQIETGDVMKVKPGKKIPTDGVVVDGQSAVDESMITGESVPVEKTEDDEVIGSTLNENGVLKIRATKTGDDTALKQIVKTVKEAQSTQPEIQNVADRISSYFVPIVILNAVTWSILWFMFPETLGNFVNSLLLWDQVAQGSTVVGGSVSVFEFSVIVFASSVLIACPCALGLATPAATMVGTTIGAQKGVIFRGGDILERAKDVDTVVFDKTGTLTEGNMELTDIATFAGFSEEDVLKYAGKAEKGSEHPLGEAVTSEAKQKEISIREADTFRNIPGQGVKATINGSSVLVGNRKLMKDNQVDISEASGKAEQFEKRGETAMFVSYDKDLIGVIAISDKIKVTSKEAVSELQSREIDVMMITGDNSRTAESVGAELNIEKDNIHAEVLPEDKSNAVSSIQEDGSRVMMVGDGVNDAPALTTAYVGVALGSGTDVAIEASDVTLMRDDPMDVLKCFRISDATLQKIKQNLFWALGYNSAMIPLASLGLLQPVLAAIAMAFSSISVLINSLVFRRYEAEDDYKPLKFLRE